MTVSSKMHKRILMFFCEGHLKTSRGCGAARLRGCGAAARLELLHDKDASDQQSHGGVPSRQQQEARSRILCILHTSHQVRGQLIQPETIQPGSCFLCHNKSIFQAASNQVSPSWFPLLLPNFHPGLQPLLLPGSSRWRNKHVCKHTRAPSKPAGTKTRPARLSRNL